MAVSISSLTTGLDTDGGATAATASVSPGSNSLILLVVKNRTNITAVPNVPTVTGNGITWTEVAHIDPDDTGASRVRLTVFRGSNAAPSAGAISMDFAAQAQTHVAWAVDELKNVNNAATDGVVQNATNVVSSGGTAVTQLIATLSAFGNNSNATWAVCGSQNSTAGYNGADGFGRVSFQQEASGVIDTQFKNSNQPTVTFNFTSHNGVGIIALEIKATTESGFIQVPWLRNRAG